jgi:hypothetical protein
MWSNLEIKLSSTLGGWCPTKIDQLGNTNIKHQICVLNMQNYKYDLLPALYDIQTSQQIQIAISYSGHIETNSINH